MKTTKMKPAIDDIQLNLFGDLPKAKSEVNCLTAASSGRKFVTGDPHSIFLGPIRLEEYLKSAGQQAPFIVGRLLDQQDWSAFEQRYAATGRAPYAPRLMMGLILYGVMQGVHSLRELERMARLDLGCMWVTGGIPPDHANIGRFITLHHDSLTQDFFESLTRSILKESGSKSTRLAGDGTVIEAACSHYKLLKEEAVRAQAEQAKQALSDAPDDSAAQKAQQESAQCLEIFEQRKAACERSGRNTAKLCISGQEPEAMMQPAKRGRGASPSYKPSALANENRIITAIAVHPSSENQVIGEMLDQSERVVGSHSEELLLDAGYFEDAVIAATLTRGISMLCPEGRIADQPKPGVKFPKSVFAYDPQTDTYRCPAGQIMMKVESCAGLGKTRKYDTYGRANCTQCPLLDNCTTAKSGRVIKRYPEDEARDALRFVMQQRQAQEIFRKRQAMIEPVFSHLRCQQGLARFRRNGLKAVKREFALHAMAYNLSRAVALLRAFFIVLYALLACSKGCKTFFCKYMGIFTGQRSTTAFLNYSGQKNGC